MKETILATYKRESTLWRNANAIYKSTDWCTMQCIFSSWEEERAFAKENGITVTYGGLDVTNEYNKDKYIVRLTNCSGKISKDWTFTNKDDANQFFKDVLNHKILKGWKKA